MVDLPSVGNGIVTSTAPQSAVSSGDIKGNADLMANALGKVADVSMDLSTELAKKQAADDLQQQKITLNADGSVNVVNPVSAPLLFGRAAEAYKAATEAGTIAEHSNVVSQEMNGLHQKYQADPAGFAAAADAWKSTYLADHGGGEVGLAIKQQADQLQTQHFNAITNTSSKLDLSRQDTSLTAAQTGAQNDVFAMLRGGANLNDPAVQSRLAQVDSLIAARQANPLFAYSKEQADLDRDTFHSQASLNRVLYDVDTTYKSKGYTAAVAKAQDILDNTAYQLSPAQRQGFYSHAMGEIRANEAIRHQDINEARSAFRELQTASSLNQTISPEEVESVRQAFRSANYPAGIAAVDAAFAHKDLHDDFGKQPLWKQTQDLNTIRGASAAKQAYQYFVGKDYRPEEAAGIVGNLIHESGVNPTAVGDSGTSGGIAQFHNERLAALKSYAASVGKPASDFQTQLDFVDHELHTTEAGTRAKLATAKTPEEAAAAFIDYERPKGWTPQNPAGGLGFQNRQSLARSVFQGAPTAGNPGPGVSSWLIANRSSEIDDTATKAWKQVMSDWSAGKGGMPSEDRVGEILNAARTTNNIDLQATVARDMDVMEKVQRVGQLPLPQQDAAELELRRQLAARTAPPGAELVEKQLTARTQAIHTGVADNPIATAVGTFPDKFKTPAPLNLQDPQQLADGLKMRSQIAQVAASNWQTGPLSALDSQEIAQVKTALSSPDPMVKAGIYGAIASLPEDVRGATLRKLGGNEPASMAEAAAGSLMATQPQIAASIFRGQAAMKADKRWDPTTENEGKRTYYADLDKALPSTTFTQQDRSDPSGPYATMSTMVRARYADLSQQAGDTNYSADRLRQAVTDVTGGVLTHNGGTIIAPGRGMTQGQFDGVLRGITDADLGNAPPTSHLAEANAALNLTPQETALYQRHFSNLIGSGGVTNADRSRSTIFQTSVEDGGRTYNIPTVWDGKILSPQDAMKRASAEGLDKFPSYGSEAEAEARYQKMHEFLERDTADYQRGRSASVTTLSGQPVTSSYLLNSARLESVGDGRYFVLLGNDPSKPVYAYQGANGEMPVKYVLDLRNRRAASVQTPDLPANPY